MSILASIVPVGVGLGLASKLAQAVHRPPRADFAQVLDTSRTSRLVERRDADGDGMLSLDEFGGALMAFVQLDQDGDGLLTAEELDEGLARVGRLRHARALADSVLERLDTNLDGLLSASELDAEDDVFDVLDADGDGFVTADELFRAYVGRSLAEGE